MLKVIKLREERREDILPFSFFRGKIKVEIIKSGWVPAVGSLLLMALVLVFYAWVFL